MGAAARTRIAVAAFTAALALSVVVFALSYGNTERLIDAAGRRQHTEIVIAEGRGLLARALETQTASRGFALSGDERFVADYRAALPEMQGHLGSLRALTADNPAQQARLDRLETVVAADVRWMDGLIAVRRRKGLRAAAAEVATLEGKRLIDQTRVVLGAVEDEETRLLAAREATLRASTARADATLVAGGLLSVALLVGVFLALGREIRRRTGAEAERARSEARLQAILDNSPAAISLREADGRLVLVNRQYERIVGRDRTAILGRTPHELFPEETARALRANDLETLQAGAPRVFEEVLPGADGPRIHLSTKFPMRDPSGSARALGVISTDITERKRSENELHRAQTFLDSIVENLPLMVFVKDAETLRFVRLNKAGEELIGVAREELIGRGDHDLFPQEEADFFTAKDREVLRGGALLDIPEEAIRTKTRGPRLLHTRKVPIRDADGRPRYLLGISEDITERRRAEERIAELHENLERHAAQLEAVNQELEAFSYSVSHDLRAPLRHVSGFADMLKRRLGDGLEKKARHYVETIARSARQMGDLIDDLLVFSRMGRSAMSQATVPLGPLVEEVRAELAPDTQGRRVAWEIGALPEVTGDRAMLRLVLTNLLGNALKYTRTRPEARIAVGSERKDRETIVWVRDNGVGFDMQYAHKLFGVFQRLHKAEEFEGTGIGLANVRRIVTRHGGRTWAEAEVDRGATFLFSLPDRRTARHEDTQADPARGRQPERRGADAGGAGRAQAGQ